MSGQTYSDALARIAANTAQTAALLALPRGATEQAVLEALDLPLERDDAKGDSARVFGLDRHVAGEEGEDAGHAVADGGGDLGLSSGGVEQIIHEVASDGESRAASSPEARP